MNALNNVKIGTKLIASFVLVAIIAAVVGVIGIVNINTIDTADTELYQKYTVPLGILGDISTTFQRTRVNLREVILSKDSAERAGYVQRLEELRSDLDKASAEYEELIVSDEMRAVFGDYEQSRRDLQPLQDKIIELAEAGKTEEALDLLRGDAYTAASAEQELILQMMSMKEEEAKAIADNNTILANTATTTMIIAILVGVIAAIALGVVLSNSITNPLQQGVVMMQELSLGHLSDRLKMFRKDEIGVLARAMDQFAEDLQNSVVANLKRISEGDLSVDVPVKDAGDEIGPAMKQTTEALRGLVLEANILTKAAIEGRLATRGDANKFKGGYREIVKGVNDTLDAVIVPLNVAAGYVDRISKGDVPAKITDNYNGDFNAIKNNLNTAIDAINFLVADAEMLAKAGIEGRLATRADAGKHQGDFRKIVQGVNDTLDAVIGPLNVAAGYVDSMAKGDIPAKITDNYNGDFEVLKGNLNRLSDSLRDMLQKIGEATNNLNSAAAEILAATTQQASGASEQSAAITQTTTTVDEVKAISEQVVERAREVTDSSKRTVEVSVAGQKAVQETIDSMYQIKEKVEGIAENILALSEKTQQIGEIIATVNDIASQSNMLALNASIEAARAGEHGKGFSVVAMEVRNLAEQSKAATAQVGAILSEIQNATNTTVMVTEEGTKGVDRGVRLAAQSQEAIEKLADTIRESAQAAMQVMAGGQQQSTGIEQISLAMKNINQVTVQSMASTKQAEKAAQNLNELSRKLADTVQSYRVN